MNIAAVIVIFVLIWWCAFFIVLPMGVKGRWESEADDVKGADPGAPTKPELKRKALIATAAAAVLTVIAVAIIMSGVINFRD